MLSVHIDIFLSYLAIKILILEYNVGLIYIQTPPELRWMRKCTILNQYVSCNHFDSEFIAFLFVVYFGVREIFCISKLLSQYDDEVCKFRCALKLQFFFGM